MLISSISLSFIELLYRAKLELLYLFCYYCIFVEIKKKKIFESEKRKNGGVWGVISELLANLYTRLIFSA